jgi:hypothetical protein
MWSGAARVVLSWTLIVDFYDHLSTSRGSEQEALAAASTILPDGISCSSGCKDSGT